MQFVLGFLTMAFIALLVGVPYALWRFSFVPFTVSRRDIAALAAKLAELEKYTHENMEQARRRMSVMSDAEVASVERRMRRDSAQRAANMERE